MQNEKLWLSLNQFELDAVDAAFPFSQRLSTENGWAVSYAREAVQEYKKFAYLAMTSQGAVTPSDEVDQVWHLHLVYTHNYWGVFTEILGRPLHHGPTKGGEAEEEKYGEQYSYTLRRYREEFNCEPPPHLWPKPNIRFARNQPFQRVRSSDYWIIQKPKNIRKLALGALALLFPLVLLAVDVSIAEAAENFEVTISRQTLIIGSLALIFAIFMFFWIRFMRKENKKDGSGKHHGGGMGCGSAGCGNSGCGGGCGS